MWSSSLTAHQKIFQNLASRTSAWDRQLVENSAKISALYGRCFQAERDCSEVERQLANVEYTQTELEHFLDKYEEEVDKLMGSTGVGEDGIGGVDAERERTYKTAENCSSRLGELSSSLTDMVDEINVTSEKLSGHNKNKESQAGADPLRQIVGVLNRHLAQLQSIGTGANNLQEKVAAAQREARTLNQQGLNGGGAWVEDFGRSYLSRR
jgi:nuclear pore complex protein Nup62